MRHRKKVKKLSRLKEHREAVLRNLATDLILYGRITTTLVKAKAVRSLVERLITYGKKNTLAARRLALKFLYKKEAMYKLFNEIAPIYLERNGGYTRIYKLDKRRRGDNSELAIIELVDYDKIASKNEEASTEESK